MIVDVHAHVFREINGLIKDGPVRGIGYGQATVGGEPLRVMPPLNEVTMHTAEMLIAHMDWVGVDKTVLLQGAFYGENNDYVLNSVSRYPERLIGAAYWDPWLEDSRKTFDSVVAGTGFHMLKLEMSETTGFSGIHPGASLTDARLSWLWGELISLGLVLVLDLGAVGAGSYQTDVVRGIAEGHPELKIVIAHLSQPRPAVEADPALWAEWEKQIDLGRLPNVWFDTASVPAYLAEEGYPYPTSERYFKAAIDRVGASKIMWGTDIPGLLGFATYPQLRKSTEINLGFLSHSDRELVMGGNAVKVFGL